MVSFLLGKCIRKFTDLFCVTFLNLRIDYISFGLAAANCRPAVPAGSSYKLPVTSYKLQLKDDIKHAAGNLQQVTCSL
jgi:hypothetical protein